MNTISIEDIVTENNLPNININIYKCMARQVKNKELQCHVFANDGITNSASVNTSYLTVYIIHNIDIQNMAFSPSTVTINVGDIVKWTNLDSVDHSATEDSTAPLFDSGLLSNGQTYMLTGLGVGTYTYHCQPHPSMTGTIIVQ